MAGTSESEDNAVAINVIPMVDVIFCLCLFFMCSFHFRQVEGELDAWLPKNKGAIGEVPLGVREIRIAVFWDEARATVSRRFGMRTVKDDVELETLLREAQEDWRARGVLDIPLVIDGDGRVPWSAVLAIVNIAKGLSNGSIEFVQAPKDA